MKNFLKNNWVKIVIIIAIILVVGVIAYLGKYYYDANKQKSERLSAEESAYNQGIKQFNSGDWQDAKSSLMQIYQDSPRYQDAQSKIITAEGNIEQQKIDSAVQKAIGPLKTQTQQAQADALAAKNAEQGKSNNQISAKELQPYLAGVGAVYCYDNRGSLVDSGSGSLIAYSADISSAYDVLTNEHVVPWGSNSGIYPCVFAQEICPSCGQYKLLKITRSFNSSSDFSLMGIYLVPIDSQSVPVASLDYALGKLRHCDGTVSIGSPVVVIGYPAYGETVTSDKSTVMNKIVTDGTISGYDFTPKISGGLPDVDYFVTAKMDAGNSGGIALSKDTKGLCVLGIPTWVNQGVYANTGMIQNINNIFYSLNINRQ